ncbi:unnamed protein product [Prunus armeniaca]
MASSIEVGGSWSTNEDIALCQSWLNISHDPITGNEMKFHHMWSKIHGEFCQRSGSIRTEMALSSRWKLLNKELGKWRNALTKAKANIQSGQNLTDEMVQAQMWFGAMGQGKKSFVHFQCWEIVKDCSRFKIIPTGPPVVMNETPLHDSTSTDSPLDSPMETESPFVPRPPRPIGRKAAKAKRGATSSNDCVQLLEQIAKSATLRIERDLKRDEMDKAREEAYALQQQMAQEKDIEDREMKIMAMDTSHMSPETKAYWKLRRRDVMRKKLFNDDGPSNTDWLNDENH